MASNTVFSINSAVTTTAQIKERPIPEGYVLLYPGIINIYLCEKVF